MKRHLPVLVVLALLTGCRPSHESANPELKRNTSANTTTDLKRFTIGDTDFGIEAAASSFRVDRSDPEKPAVTIEITGDRSTFDPLTVDDDSQWSWALHPPGFYLRGFPLRTDPSSTTATAHVMRDDVEDYEFSIYMMEHNLIEEMDVEVISNTYLAVSGRVDLFGDIHDFRIEWQREESKSHNETTHGPRK